MNPEIFARIDRSMKIAQFLWAFVAVASIGLLFFTKDMVLLMVNGFLLGFSFCAIVTLGVLRRHVDVMRFTTTTYVAALNDAEMVIQAMATRTGVNIVDMRAANDITKH